MRLTSQSGGFPGSLQRGGGGGHDVRRRRHRAARGDAHALHKQVVKNFTIFGSHSMMADLKSYQIFLLPASSWQACPVRGWGSAPPPPSCSTSHLKCILRQPGNTKAVFPQIHCCNSHKSIFTDSHKARGSFHTLLPQLELSAPKTLSMLK